MWRALGARRSTLLGGVLACALGAVLVASAVPSAAATAGVPGALRTTTTTAAVRTTSSSSTSTPACQLLCLSSTSPSLATTTSSTALALVTTTTSATTVSLSTSTGGSGCGTVCIGPVTCLLGCSTTSTTTTSPLSTSVGGLLGSPQCVASICITPSCTLQLSGQCSVSCLVNCAPADPTPAPAGSTPGGAAPLGLNGPSGPGSSSGSPSKTAAGPAVGVEVTPDGVTGGSRLSRAVLDLDPVPAIASVGPVSGLSLGHGVLAWPVIIPVCVVLLVAVARIARRTWATTAPE